MFPRPSPHRGAQPAWGRNRPRFVILLALVFLGFANAGYAHQGQATRSQSAEAVPAGGQAEALTQSLTAQHARYQGADAGVRAQALGDLLEVAAERHELLAGLIEKDPGEVMRLALPEAHRAGMPAEVQEFLEQGLELEGMLEILHVDYQDPAQSHYVYLLKTDSGERYSLHFAHHPPGLLSGAKVRAHGLVLFGAKARDAGETDGAVAVEDGETSVELLEAGGSKNTGTNSGTTSVLPNTLGAQKTLVILVNFQDNPLQPYTPADAENMIFGTTSDFFLENSYQQTWLSGDVVGWYTIPVDSTVCNSSSIENYARAAASAAGYDLSAYSHHVYMFPQNTCGWAGLSSVGGAPSRSWINGKLKLGITAHELGHALGLFHSHSLECDTATLGSNCIVYEYGDTLDMMGASFGHFNAFQKERLGWLNGGASPPLTTVLGDGTYTLEPYEPVGSGPKALKILKSTDPSTGKRTWYYVQFLQAIGFDGALAGNANVLNGVVIRFGTESNGNSGHLLDMTPASGTTIYYDWKDPALVVGQRFEDPAAGVTMTTEWVTGTEAAVSVRFEGVVSVATNQASYTRTQTVSVTAKLSSGGSPIVNAPVTFTVSKSNGAVVTGTATTGSTGSAVYKLRLTKQDPVGSYQAGAAALSSSAATNFTVN
ncbi:MAG: NEW3 domain-containing protein [Gammaproteobacteria bacterium]